MNTSPTEYLKQILSIEELRHFDKIGGFPQELIDKTQGSVTYNFWVMGKEFRRAIRLFVEKYIVFWLKRVPLQ